MPIAALIFDLDGTLVETAPEIMDATNDTLRRFDLAEVTQQQVNDWIGHGTHTLLVSALADAKQTSTEAIHAWDGLSNASTVFNGFYQQRCGTRSHLYPHVRSVLAELAQKGVRLAVVTNKEGRFTQTVLKAHAMENTFDIVINATSAGRDRANEFTLPLGLVNSMTTAVDLNYGDAAIAFLAWARSAECRNTVDGLGMLVEQAAESFQQWHEVRPDTDAVYVGLRGNTRLTGEE